MTRPTAKECRAAIERLGFWLSAMRAGEECAERDDCPACVAWREWRRAESAVRELAARTMPRRGDAPRPAIGWRVAVCDATASPGPPPPADCPSWLRVVRSARTQFGGLAMARGEHKGRTWTDRAKARREAQRWVRGDRWHVRLIRVVRRADR